MHRLAPILLFALAACSVDVGDYSGKRCDADNGCLDGRECVQGVCVARGSGVTDAGTSDAGIAVDAGVTWRQINSGFDFTRECSGCVVTVTPTADNRLDVSIVDAASDQAEAVEQNQLISGATGVVGGRVQLSSLPTARLTLVYLESNSGGPLLRLSVESNGALRCESAANALQASAVNVSSGAGLITAGAPHLIDASFVQGAKVRVFVDRVAACDATLAPFSNAQATPRELRLGIDSYDGTATTGLNASFSEWVIGSNAAARLYP